MFPATFGFLQNQFAVLKIHESELQHCADPHASPGHQFEHQPVPRFGGSENDFIDSLFLDDFPFRDHPLAILFTDHRRIAWIMQTVIQIVTDEIEEGTNVGVADALGVGLVTFGESIQKPQDIINGGAVASPIHTCIAESKAECKLSYSS